MMTYEETVTKIVNSIDDVIEIATGEAAAIFLAEFSDRVFNKGLTAKETSIGRYSEAYAEVRKQYGLQTTYVDLTFTTDLFRSIVQDKNTVIFKNEYGQDISAENERIFKKKIFEPSDKEREIAIEVMTKEVNKLFE